MAFDSDRSFDFQNFKPEIISLQADADLERDGAHNLWRRVVLLLISIDTDFLIVFCTPIH